MGWGLAVVLSVLASVAAAEIWAWLPALAARLVRFHASRLPRDLALRCQEEWAAVLDSLPGNLAKLAFALDLFRATPRLRHEFLFPTVPFRPFADLGARCFDIVLSGTGVVVALPGLSVIALLLKVIQGGPVFATPKRVGRHRQAFSLLRLRTAGPDGRSLSRFGAAIRCLVLDELPTLVNVLRGDMSFVGPRPRRPGEPGVRSYRRNAALAVRPGLTGLDQLARFLPGCPHADPARDLVYVHRRGFALYMRVILATAFAGLGARRWVGRIAGLNGKVTE